MLDIRFILSCMCGTPHRPFYLYATYSSLLDVFISDGIKLGQSRSIFILANNFSTNKARTSKTYNLKRLGLLKNRLASSARLKSALERVWELVDLEGGRFCPPPTLSRLSEELESRNVTGGWASTITLRCKFRDLRAVLSRSNDVTNGKFFAIFGPTCRTSL